MSRPTRRVLLVENGSLLDLGLKNMLMEEADLNLEEFQYTDEAALLHRVSDASPDMVVLSEADPNAGVSVFELLKGIAGTASLRVIFVRAADNSIDVYERQRLTVAKRDDLIALVRRGGNGV